MDLDTIESLAKNPEYKSVEDFVDYCMDDERTTFTHVELRALAFNARTSASKVRGELEGFGLKLEVREPAKAIRGFTANPHDRWYGKGACKSHGGSGWEQIAGFAGQKG
jgi:hypothetical protein